MHAVSPKLTDWLFQLNQLIRRLQDSGYKPTAIGAREALANVTRTLVSPGPEIAWVNDEIVHGRDYSVPVRIYHPAPDEARPAAVPARWRPYRWQRQCVRPHQPQAGSSHRLRGGGAGIPAGTGEPLSGGIA
jgi:hypothetical protein